jgi:hypothetical protein
MLFRDQERIGVIRKQGKDIGHLQGNSGKIRDGITKLNKAHNGEFEANELDTQADLRRKASSPTRSARTDRTLLLVPSMTPSSIPGAGSARRYSTLRLLSSPSTTPCPGLPRGMNEPVSPTCTNLEPVYSLAELPDCVQECFDSNCFLQKPLPQLQGWPRRVR